MIIGLTLWGERISPVFDSCHMLLVTEVQDSVIVKKRFEPFEPVIPFLLSKRISELKIDVLICGAISIEPSNLIESTGIKLIPFISGNADNILESFINGERLSVKFIMPGCGKSCNQPKRKGRGCGRNFIK